MNSSTHQKLFDVQNVDRAIRTIRRRYTDNEFRHAVASADASRAAAIVELQSVEHEQDANERTQRSLRQEVDTQEAKRDSTYSKLYGGSVSAPNELLALEEELAGHTAKVDKVEFDLLTLMEDADRLADLHLQKSDALAMAESSCDQAETDLQAALTAMTAELDDLTRQRERVAAEVPPELLTDYERLIEEFDGQPIARLVNGLCDGCHITLSAVAVDRVCKLPEGVAASCDECGRILLR